MMVARKNSWRWMLLCAIGCLLFGASAYGAVAGGACADCNGCSSCDRSASGTSGCDFGGKDGCCQQTGTACNATITAQQNLLLKPLELYHIETPSGALELARIDATHYVTWSCKTQGYEVYRQEKDGSFHRENSFPGTSFASLTLSVGP